MRSICSGGTRLTHHSKCDRSASVAAPPCSRRTLVCLAARHADVRDSEGDKTRRAVVAGLAAGLCTLSGVQSAHAAIELGPDYKKELARRRRKIPEEEFTLGPDGLKFYDIVAGGGAEAKVGARVAVHYDVKYRNVTFVTSRQGLGVTGGTPVGFNVGTAYGDAGSTLPGIDLGVRGMKVGGVRRLIVPPQLAYGAAGVGEIPPNATLNVDVELLSIKTSPIGYRTKLVEG